LRVDDLLDGRGAEGADQLVLQVCDAHVEAESFHVGAGEVGAEAGPLEGAPELVLLSDVAEPRQLDVVPRGPSSSRKLPIACAPPIERTDTPSA
jgi:hypothetical protein